MKNSEKKVIVLKDDWRGVYSRGFRGGDGVGGGGGSSEVNKIESLIFFFGFC